MHNKWQNCGENMSIDSAYADEKERCATAQIGKFNIKKNSIELSFNNMKFKELANGKIRIDNNLLNKASYKDSQEIKNQFMSAQRTSTNRNEFDSPKKESAYRYFENTNQCFIRTNGFKSINLRSKNNIHDAKIRLQNACTFYPTFRRRARQFRMQQLISSAHLK